MRMRRIAAALAVLILAPATGSTGLTVLGHSPELTPLAFLAGSCWHGPFPDGQKIDSHCFRWFQDGQYLRDRNELIGSDPPYGGEATYYWDHSRKTIAYTYWANDGGMSVGTVVTSSDVIAFPDEQYTGKEGTMRLRSEIRPTGNPNEFQRKVWVIGQDGSETPISNAIYVRKPLNW